MIENEQIIGINPGSKSILQIMQELGDAQYKAAENFRDTQPKCNVSVQWKQGVKNCSDGVTGTNSKTIRVRGKKEGYIDITINSNGERLGGKWQATGHLNGIGDITSIIYTIKFGGVDSLTILKMPLDDIKIFGSYENG